MKKYLWIILLLCIPLSVNAEYFNYNIGTLTVKDGPWKDPKGWGTVVLGASVTGAQKTANANAIKAAIDNATSGGIVQLPPGIIYVDGNIIKLNSDGVHLKGWGEKNTIIYVDSGVAITISRDTAAQIVNTSVSDLSVIGQGALAKTGIKLVDGNVVNIHDVSLLMEVYTGEAAVTIGLQLQGRDTNRLNRATINADKPISIEDNPNSILDLDHFHAQDLYLICTDNTSAPVTINTGVNITNLTFDGYQAWVQGKYGLLWNDSTTSIASLNVKFRNVRWEQATDSTGYVFYVSHNTGVYELILDHVYGATNQAGTQSTNGAYFRKVFNGTIVQSTFLSGQLGAARTSLDIDTCRNIVFSNLYVFNASTQTFGATMKKKLWLVSDNDGGIQFGQMDTDTNSIPFLVNSVTGGSPIALNDGDITTLGIETLIGFIYVNESDGTGAIYLLRGTTHGTIEVSDPSGLYSTTQGTGSSTNIYYDAGTTSYKLENKRGAPITYRYLITGGLSW